MAAGRRWAKAGILSGDKAFGSTGRRMVQSAANCSPRSDSLIIRENTGNFVHSRRFCRFAYSESPRLHWPSSANSLLNRTGNFDRVSGKSCSLIDFRSAKSAASQNGLIPITEGTLVLNPSDLGAASENLPWQQRMAAR